MLPFIYRIQKTSHTNKYQKSWKTLIFMYHQIWWLVVDLFVDAHHLLMDLQTDDRLSIISTESI